MNNMFNKISWLPRLRCGSFAVTGLILISLFSACSDDQVLSDSQPELPGKGAPNTITLCLSAIPDAETRSASTRDTNGDATDDIIDNYIDDLWVLLYNEEGNKLLESSYCTSLTRVDNSDTQWNAAITLYTDFGEKCKIFCLANTHDRALFDGDRSKYNTIDKLKGMSIPLSKESPQDLWMYTPPGGANPRYSIPMRGVGRAVDDVATGLNADAPLISLSENMSVSLHYLLARVSFNVKSTISTIEVRSLRLMTVPSTLNLFAPASELVGTDKTYIDYPVAYGIDATQAKQVWYVPRNLREDHDTADPSTSTHIRVYAYSSQKEVGRFYCYYPHTRTDEGTVSDYNFNLEGSTAYTYTATISGSSKSDLTENIHWSVVEGSAPYLLKKESASNCIVVPSSNTNGLTNGFAFDIAPQLKAYEAYVAEAKAASRDLTPATLLDSGDGWTVSILWMSGETLVTLHDDELVRNGTGPTGQVIFTLPALDVRGNAVVEIKHAGVTVWSWHLWILPKGLNTFVDGEAYTTYTPKNSAYETAGYMDNKSYTMLNYNLGATATGMPDAAIPGGNSGHDTFGLYYQWGRKDPFPDSGSRDIDNTHYYTGAGGNYTAATADAVSSATANLSYSIQHPGTFIKYSNSNPWSGSDSHYSWGGYEGNGTTFGGDDNVSYYFIEKAKTPFDPCPFGYRVPPVGAFDSDGDMYSTESSSSFYGYDWSGGSSACPVPATFPASGCRNSTGTVHSQGTTGFFWAASPSPTSNGFYLGFYSWFVLSRIIDYRTAGYAVRCVAVG